MTRNATHYPLPSRSDRSHSLADTFYRKTLLEKASQPVHPEDIKGHQSKEVGFLDICINLFLGKTLKARKKTSHLDWGMLTSKVVLKKISENREIIKGYGVRNIGLFGSYAQGTQRKGSDVDILVEFEEGKKTFDNYMELKLFLEDLLNREVDLVTIQSLKPDLKPYVQKSVKYAPKL